MAGTRDFVMGVLSDAKTGPLRSASTLEESPTPNQRQHKNNGVFAALIGAFDAASQPSKCVWPGIRADGPPSPAPDARLLDADFISGRPDAADEGDEGAQFSKEAMRALQGNSCPWSPMLCLEARRGGSLRRFV